MHISLLLDMAADAFADRPVVSAAGETLSYGALRAAAQGGATWLATQPGERVVYLGVNGLGLPVSLFAAAMAGRPFVPLNYRLPDADLRKLLARSAPAVVVVDGDMMARIGEVEGVTLIASSAFLEIARAGAGATPLLGTQENDIAVLLFTSGTTGEPKAAVLRHANLAAYVISTVEFMGAEEGEAALVSVPPYHIAGVSAVLTGVYGGRCLVYLSAFSGEGWVEAAAREQVTHAMVVPTMLGRVLDALEAAGTGLPALRALSYGGGRMPTPVIERALARLPHVDFVNAYGLTETSSTIAILGPEDHRAAIASERPEVRRRLGSVGRPLPALELEIRDEAGRPCPPGVPGEIHVRGEQVSGEYLGRSLLTPDGWFPTKDAGWLDEDGYLFVDGRLDDVIVRGGENISPGEVEDVLRTHPGVRDVAVCGLPDEQWGEKIVAILVCDGAPPAAQQLADFVKSRLRSTRTPDIWVFRDALPYTETGKLLRRVLKAELSAPSKAA